MACASMPPLDAAINHAFEARITKNNARATQYELASVRGLLGTPTQHADDL